MLLTEQALSQEAILDYQSAQISDVTRDRSGLNFLAKQGHTRNFVPMQSEITLERRGMPLTTKLGLALTGFALAACSALQPSPLESPVQPPSVCPADYTHISEMDETGNNDLLNGQSSCVATYQIRGNALATEVRKLINFRISYNYAKWGTACDQSYGSGNKTYFNVDETTRNIQNAFTAMAKDQPDKAEVRSVASRLLYGDLDTRNPRAVFDRAFKTYQDIAAYSNLYPSAQQLPLLTISCINPTVSIYDANSEPMNRIRFGMATATPITLPTSETATPTAETQPADQTGGQETRPTETTTEEDGTALPSQTQESCTTNDLTKQIICCDDTLSSAFRISPSPVAMEVKFTNGDIGRYIPGSIIPGSNQSWQSTLEDNAQGRSVEEVCLINNPK